MPDEIRVAVFGNGFARTVVLPCLARVDGARVVGLASRTIERARETAAQFGIEHVEADHRTLLDRARPDLVFVVTPPHRHLDMSLDALAVGCHVVCEKPTALSAEESARMAAAARAAHGRLALIDHELRFDPRRVHLGEMLDAGRLGVIHHATYVVTSAGRRSAATQWDWWSDAAQGGGMLGAVGSHAVDALLALLGPILEVRGTLQTFVKERKDATGVARRVTSDDYAAAWLRFASGARATLILSAVEGERVHRVTIAGSDGAARLTEQEPLFVQRGGEPMAPVAVREDDVAPAGDIGIPETDWARNFLRFARRLVGTLLDERGELPGAATFEDGHRVQLVLDAVRRSAAAERWEPVEGAVAVSVAP